MGAFTSPHLLRYNERIRVNGIEASDDELIAAFEAIDAARGGTTLTFFEFNALAALCVFRSRGVEFAVLEVGLGGRLDAANIVDAEGRHRLFHRTWTTWTGWARTSRASRAKRRACSAVARRSCSRILR